MYAIYIYVCIAGESRVALEAAEGRLSSERASAAEQQEQLTAQHTAALEQLNVQHSSNLQQLQQLHQQRLEDLAKEHQGTTANGAIALLISPQ